LRAVPKTLKSSGNSEGGVPSAASVPPPLSKDLEIQPLRSDGRSKQKLLAF
jgi:hypothetical protein